MLYPEFLATSNLSSQVENDPKHFARTVWHWIQSNGKSFPCSPILSSGSTRRYPEAIGFIPSELKI